MKSLNQDEINESAKSLKPLVGHHIQDVVYSDNCLTLGFYGGPGEEKSVKWMVIEMGGPSPFLFAVEQIKSPIKKGKSPVQLFIKSHFAGRQLIDISVDEDIGRKIDLYFSGDDKAVIELVLFPQGKNIICTANEKSISLRKQVPLDPSMTSSSERAEIRSPDDLSAFWFETRGRLSGPKASKQKNDQHQDLKALIRSRQTAIEKIEKAIGEHEGKLWAEFGLLLKSQRNMNVPEEYEEYLDTEIGLDENIERAFEQNRKLKQKVAGSRKRIKELRDEISRLEKGELPSAPKRGQTSSRTGKNKARARTLTLDNGNQFRVGKNAADNLKLLRSAKSWDLWLHLADVPSAHGILNRNRGQKIDDSELLKAGQFLVEMSEGKRHLGSGDVVKLLVAECRHVRPIKGDKVGRVTYQNERTLSFKL